MLLPYVCKEHLSLDRDLALAKFWIDRGILKAPCTFTWFCILYYCPCVSGVQSCCFISCYLWEKWLIISLTNLFIKYTPCTMHVPSPKWLLIPKCNLVTDHSLVSENTQLMIYQTFLTGQSVLQAPSIFTEILHIFQSHRNSNQSSSLYQLFR